MRSPERVTRACATDAVPRRLGVTAIESADYFLSPAGRRPPLTCHRSARPRTEPSTRTSTREDVFHPRALLRAPLTSAAAAASDAHRPRKESVPRKIQRRSRPTNFGKFFPTCDFSEYITASEDLSIGARHSATSASVGRSDARGHSLVVRGARDGSRRGTEREVAGSGIGRDARFGRVETRCRFRGGHRRLDASRERHGSVFVRFVRGRFHPARDHGPVPAGGDVDARGVHLLGRSLVVARSRFRADATDKKRRRRRRRRVASPHARARRGGVVQRPARLGLDRLRGPVRGGGRVRRGQEAQVQDERG